MAKSLKLKDMKFYQLNFLASYEDLLRKYLIQKEMKRIYKQLCDCEKHYQQISHDKQPPKELTEAKFQLELLLLHTHGKYTGAKLKLHTIRRFKKQMRHNQ